MFHVRNFSYPKRPFLLLSIIHIYSILNIFLFWVEELYSNESCQYQQLALQLNTAVACISAVLVTNLIKVHRLCCQSLLGNCSKMQWVRLYVSVFHVKWNLGTQWLASNHLYSNWSYVSKQWTSTSEQKKLYHAMFVKLIDGTSNLSIHKAEIAWTKYLYLKQWTLILHPFGYHQFDCSKTRRHSWPCLIRVTMLHCIKLCEEFE